MPNKLETALALLNAMEASNKNPTKAEWNALRTAVANEYHAANASTVGKAAVPAAKAVPIPASTPIKPLPAGCVIANISGAPGLVKLTGTFVNPKWAAEAYGIDEVKQCYATNSPEYRFLQANIQDADNKQIVEGANAIIPACRPILSEPTPRVDMSKPAISGTLALPTKAQDGHEMYRTVAQAQAWMGKLPESITSDSSGFSPAKP